KDDDDNDLPAGKYSARGFLVAPMKIESPTETTASNATPPKTNSVHIKLVANPLENNDRPVVDISAALDEDSAILQTSGGLQLVTIAKRGDATTVSLGAGRDPKSVIVFLSNDATTRQVAVSGLSEMMAFDCGHFELK